MEHNSKRRMGDFLSAPVPQTVIVAISGRKNSKYLVEWAMDNLHDETTTFKLLYVSAKITSIPTPMEVIPISEVPENIVASYRQEIEWKKNEMLDIYKKMFARKKVLVDVLNVEGDDIAQAIADEIDKGHVNKLVIGASSRGGMFTSKINGERYSSKITEVIPSFCTVYAVSKEKLSSTKTGGSIRKDNSNSLQTERPAAPHGYSPPSPSYSDLSSHPYIRNHSEISEAMSPTTPGTPFESETIMNWQRGLYQLNRMTESPITDKKNSTEREHTETKCTLVAGEIENPTDTTYGLMQQCKEIRWEEILTATSSFSENNIIEQGASGTFFKCNLNNTNAAVKVLHSREFQSVEQFQQELEILSRIRHPYLLLLLGACPEQGCIVFEHMENGSLKDRLFRRNNNTAPIPWYHRFRIAWEIASGLIFLHNSKPEQIIHPELKLANILLDHNLGSKIDYVGLSNMVQSVEAPAMSMFTQTSSIGTLSYIDPELQRTGVNSPKSDVYAFGMIILQLLTAKTTTTLVHQVETAVDDCTLGKLLDRKAGQWPLEEAKELAILGLSCAELRRRDRPDLKTHVLPTLERLRAAADRARDAAHYNLSAPPSHFLCPIMKEPMMDPCVAADGYTYDRKSIEKWLETIDTSPMTNLPLGTKNLIPNFTILKAISQWKSEQS